MRWVARHAALITVPCALAMAIGPASAQGHAHGHTAPVTVTGHAAAVTASQQAGVRRYWTRARMERAVALRPVLPRRHAEVGQRTPVAIGKAQVASPEKAPPSPGKPLASPGKPLPSPGKPLAVPAKTATPPPAKRLSAAVNGTLWADGGAVARTTGKVFFSMGGHDYVCSGSTVASADSAVVVTAGHCVKNGTGVWATNWTFVPGYTNGNDPYGSFTANQFYVASQWSAQASNDYDVAFVRLNPAKVDGTQVNAVQEVGGQGIKFGVEPTTVTAFGYPADPPYNGQRIYYCSGTVQPDPYHETDDTGLTCAMTEGSSGGPWLAGFGQTAGTGSIVSVSSFKYSTNDKILYGTPLGSVAQQLYQAAQAG
jgi:V8-like Glu-specific endopeptidase